MRYHEVTRMIDASPDVVWSILTDPKTLANGQFSILRIEGVIREGGQIDLWSEVDPKRKFRLKIVSLEPGRRMVWESGMPFGLFRGARVFELARQGTGTQFRMREDYSGPLAGLMIKVIPDLQPSFEIFGDGLKTTVEAQG